VYQNDFSPDEFKARRHGMCEAAGDNALILLQGADGPRGHGVFRQYNELYYFCGVEVPHAYLLVDSSTEKATLLLPRESQVGRQAEGEILSADNAKYVCEVTGVDETLGLEALAGRVQRAPVLYTPFAEGQDRTVSRDTHEAWYRQVLSDPWDGRPDRAMYLVEKIRTRFPHIEVRDLRAAIDELRGIKSPGEIELLRVAGELAARGICEAIRSTRPGVMEYQLDAVMRYHYLAGGARDRGYGSLIPSGANVWYGHYCRNDGELTDGDWVLGDSAPDYRYYTSDIGRMWPVSGKYSPDQRALYGFVVEYHKAVLDRIAPGRMVAEIHADAAEHMTGVLANWEFGSPQHETAAREMLEFQGHISHGVGMAVHDGGLHYKRPLEPGMVFTVDPQMWVRPAKLYVRVEDTVVVTEDGIENFTQQAPLELDDVEAMMREDGLLQAFGPEN